MWVTTAFCGNDQVLLVTDWLPDGFKALNAYVLTKTNY